MIILIEFLDFSLENGTSGNTMENCIWDKVFILDGNKEKILDTTCGIQPVPRTFHSYTNKAILKFITDEDVTDRGFLLHYKGVVTPKN